MHINCIYIGFSSYPKTHITFFFDTSTIPIIRQFYEIFSLRDFDSTYPTMGCDLVGLLISIYISTCVSEL